MRPLNGFFCCIFRSRFSVCFPRGGLCSVREPPVLQLFPGSYSPCLYVPRFMVVLFLFFLWRCRPFCFSLKFPHSFHMVLSRRVDKYLLELAPSPRGFLQLLWGRMFRPLNLLFPLRSYLLVAGPLLPQSCRCFSSAETKKVS